MFLQMISLSLVANIPLYICTTSLSILVTEREVKIGRLGLTYTHFMHWRRKWQLTPVFLPGESQGRGSLVGCRLWGRTELDTTEVT